MDWETMLAYITGSVEQELLLRNEYLVAENRILRNQLQGRLHLTDGERRALGEVSEGRVPVEAHPVRGEVTSPCAQGLPHPSSPREESPGQGKPSVISHCRTGIPDPRPGSVSGTARWTPPFLPPGSRMSFLTTRPSLTRSKLVSSSLLDSRGCSSQPDQ